MENGQGTLVLGVDGGGSKTHAVLVDGAGRRLGTGLAGSANHQIVGAHQALAHVKAAVDQALGSTPSSAVAEVQFSLAGLDRPADFTLVQPLLATLGFSRWDLGVDTWSGLRTGCPDHVGLVLICGNGTNAAGRNRAGETLHVGGVGTLYGDGTGATFLATEMFRSASRSWEGREIPSSLPSKLLQYFHFPSMEALRDDFLDRNLTTIREPGLVVPLHEAAAEGDELARSLLRTAGRELGLAGNAVVRRLGNWGPGPLKVVLIGGVVQQGRSPVLLEELKKTMGAATPDLEFVIPSLAPVYGAVLLALDRAGMAAGPEIHDTFASYGGYEP